MNTDGKRLVVVGGGAAGLTAAIAAGERARELGVPLAITVFERDDRVGRSILATGNGRCNFSNHNIKFFAYHNYEFVGQAIGRIGIAPDDDMVHSFFASHGLAWREEDDGRQYPQANKASVVVDVLRASAAAVGVREACEREVAAIDPPREAGKPFTLRMADGVLERADAVIVACGGKASESLAAEGLAFMPLQPVLGPLRCAPEDVKLTRELDNIRVRCTASLVREDGDGFAVVAMERGELMFRKYGVSGICVYDLSRKALPGDEISINFLPDFDPFEEGEAEGFLGERWDALSAQFGALSYGDFLRGLLLPRVYEALLKRKGLHANDVCSRDDAIGLASLLTMFHLKVEGIAEADQCQVRRGGFDVEGFDPATMQARAIPGLYAAGEALDVDGPCGGYNLHWAWSSGLIAGRSAADWVYGSVQ
ncbi:MAG: aminoacetone oxidase family FAD-binding enzyme [Eggerthellaceae bacterium]|nr:aminoacetone oxidase family FAD-binding enzyme [Eggerthellaceae bacterium]